MHTYRDEDIEKYNQDAMEKNVRLLDPIPCIPSNSTDGFSVLAREATREEYAAYMAAPSGNDAQNLAIAVTYAVDGKSGSEVPKELAQIEQLGEFYQAIAEAALRRHGIGVGFRSTILNSRTSTIDAEKMGLDGGVLQLVQRYQQDALYGGLLMVALDNGISLVLRRPRPEPFAAFMRDQQNTSRSRHEVVSDFVHAHIAHPKSAAERTALFDACPHLGWLLHPELIKMRLRGSGGEGKG
jgi:hypothetical protein